MERDITSAFTTSGEPPDIHLLREIRSLEKEVKRLREENARLQSVMDNATDENGLPTAGSLYVRALEQIVRRGRAIERLQAENEQLKESLLYCRSQFLRPVCAYCGRHPPYCDCDTYPFPEEASDGP